MGYQVYDESSCTLTDDERRAEADRIVKRLLDEIMLQQDKMKVISMRKGPISIKQLFLLRDLNSRY